MRDRTPVQEEKAGTHITATVQTGLLQRTCACGGGGAPGIDDQCDQCREKQLSMQHSSTRDGQNPPISTSITPVAGYNLSRLPVHPASSAMLQTKLVVNEPGDKYEQEADQVAERVMRSSESEEPQKVKASFEKDIHIQRAPSGAANQQLEDNDEQTEEEEHPEDEAEATLQAKEAAGETPRISPELQTRINSLKGGGQSLSEPTRAFMEPRLGHDFSQVRIHSDTAAAEMTQAVRARAFTLGNNIVFGSGMYIPGTTEGKKLLAHELTHVIQQKASSSTIFRQPAEAAQVSTAQSEWQTHPAINTRYGSWQEYEVVRSQVTKWTNPPVTNPASYIEEAIGEWNANKGIHSSFGAGHGNNFDGKPDRSYLNLKRLYQAQHNIQHPASYLASNIVSIQFFNKKTPGHRALQEVLARAQKDMTAAGHTFTLGKGTWAYVPRTYNDNINKLSNHALGKAIDINPSSNPHIKSRKDILVINEVCKTVLPDGLLKEKSFATLKRASDYFQAHFNDTWVNEQKTLLAQMEAQHPHPKEFARQKRLVESINSRYKALKGYAATGFLNLPQELVEGLQKAGLNWGGEWDTAKDFMHFELRNP